MRMAWPAPPHATKCCGVSKSLQMRAGDPGLDPVLWPKPGPNVLAALPIPMQGRLGYPLRMVRSAGEVVEGRQASSSPASAAVQRVVGSNPVSRFAKKPRSGGVFGGLSRGLAQQLVDRHGQAGPDDQAYHERARPCRPPCASEAGDAVLPQIPGPYPPLDVGVRSGG